MTVVYEDARILITNCNISSDADLEAIAKIVKTDQRPLVIIAQSLSDRVLGALVQNKFKQGLQVVAINPPEFGERRSQVLEDIAIVTGAKLITSALGMKVSDASVADLGFVKKIVVDKDSTVLSFDESSSKSLIEERVAHIRTLLSKENDNEFNQAFLEKRIARLSGGIAVIYAGGKTDVESKELRARIDDAVGATRSSIEEGIVVGGGTTLYQISKELAKKELDGSSEFKAGYNVVLSSIQRPLEMLVENSNQNPGTVMAHIDAANAKSKKPEFGFNAYTDKVENLRKARVFDPAKVLRVAIENSASAAGALITTACSVVIVYPKE
jgi:chaperonin GroEL